MVAPSGGWQWAGPTKIKEQDMPGQTTFDKVIVMAVAALLGAFALSVAGPVLTQAGADEISGKRDDDLREIEVKDDDDDEGDSANRSRGSGGSKSSGNGGSKNSGNGDGSKSRSRESNTTRGTGPSNTNTRDTKTGTFTRASR